MDDSPFFHRGTCKLAASDTATRGTLITNSQGGAAQVMVYNAGPNIAYVDLGDSTVAATVPTSAGTGSMPVPPYFTTGIFTRDSINDTHVSAICESGETATVFISVGAGI